MAMQTDISTSPQARYWSTASVEPDRALRFWLDVICSQLVELDVRPQRSECFEAWMLQRPLGPVSLNFIYTREPQEVWRTEQAIHRSRESRFDLLYVSKGSFTFDHYGRSFALEEDECVLIDSTEPYFFRSSALAAGTSLQIPQSWLKSWVAAPQDGVARVITTQTPWGRALVATLAALSPKSIEDLPLSGDVVSEQVASLLTLAIGGGASAPQSSGRRRSLYAQVARSLREQAHDENLSPTLVAQRHGISKRYLHTLFAASGTTFGAELMSIRLERARLHLSNPQFRHLSVSEIGWRCGFTDSGHFTRRFHQRYGMSPRALRRNALPAAEAAESRITGRSDSK